MIDYSTIIGVAIVNLLVDFVFVLVLNPKAASTKIKAEIQSDKQFIDAMTKDILYSVTDEESIQLMKPIFNYMQAQFMGTIQGFENIIENPSEIKALKSAIAQDAMDSYPEVATILELFPSVKAKIKKNPALIEGFLQYGLPMIQRLIGAQ